MSRAKVFIYGMNYAPEIAGVGKYTGEIGEYLSSRGCDVSVVTTHSHYPGWELALGSKRWWTKDKISDVKIIRCPLFLRRNMSGFKRLLAPISFAVSSAPVAAWKILINRPNIVLVIEPTIFVAPIAILCARIVGAKSVLHIQDLEVDAAFAMGHLEKWMMLSSLAFRFEKFILKRFDQIVTIADAMARRICEKGVRQSCVIVVRNWVDLGRIKPDNFVEGYRAELGIPEDAFVVLYSGNIGAKQGISVLLNAARKVSHEPGIFFVVAGRGPMKREIEREAALVKNLKVMDFQPEENFSAFLSLADVHVLPQEKEAADLLLPSKLGGMLASGRPVIVTADFGTELTEFLGTSCAVTPAGDAACLAQAILQMRDTLDTRDAKAHRLRLAKRLSKEVMISAFADAILSR